MDSCFWKLGWNLKTIQAISKVVVLNNFSKSDSTFGYLKVRKKLFTIIIFSLFFYFFYMADLNSTLKQTAPTELKTEKNIYFYKHITPTELFKVPVGNIIKLRNSK